MHVSPAFNLAASTALYGPDLTARHGRTGADCICMFMGTIAAELSHGKHTWGQV